MVFKERIERITITGKKMKEKNGSKTYPIHEKKFGLFRLLFVNWMAVYEEKIDPHSYKAVLYFKPMIHI